MEANAICCLFQTMQQGFGLVRAICKKHDVICIICIYTWHHLLLIFFFLLREFFISAFKDVFHWSLSDSKSPRVFRTLLCILAILNNAVVLMVSTYPHVSKFSSPLTNHLGFVQRAPITIDITVTFMFHSFFFVLKQGLSTYLYFLILLILLCSLPGQQSLWNARLSFFVDYH